MKKVAGEYLYITLGMVIVTVAVYFFMLPLHIVLGSISGLALVLVQVFPLPISAMTLILNVFCLVAGFLLVGKEFGVKTVYASLLQPLFLAIFETVFPDQKSITGDLILDTLAMLVIVSIGQAILFQVQASSGGLDIVAKILNKFLHVEIGKAVSAAGIVIVLSSAIFYDGRTVVAGLLGTYMNGMLVDEYIGGFLRKKRVCILSDHYEDLMAYIHTELKRGATLYEAKGSYEGVTRTELVSILTRNEYAMLMHYIQETDPQAFVTVSTVNEVAGVWNKKDGKLK